MIFAPEGPNAETLEARVVRVFDGDGILARIWHPSRQAEIDVAVRFGFIDAPEMGQPGGVEAHAYLRSLIGGQLLDLVPLMKDQSGRMTDRWCRMFCVPYLRDAGVTVGHRNIELEMVLNGWAWVLEHWGPDPSYRRALEEARAERRGIWAQDGNVAPWIFKQRAARQRERVRQQPDLFG